MCSIDLCNMLFSFVSLVYIISLHIFCISSFHVFINFNGRSFTFYSTFSIVEFFFLVGEIYFGWFSPFLFLMFFSSLIKYMVLFSS